MDKFKVGDTVKLARHIARRCTFLVLDGFKPNGIYRVTSAGNVFGGGLCVKSESGIVVRLQMNYGDLTRFGRSFDLVGGGENKN